MSENELSRPISRPRRKRTDSSETFKKLIGVGVDHQLSNELAVVVEEPLFEEIVKATDVARSMAYRLFAYKQDYTRAVIGELVASHVYRPDEFVSNSREAIANKNGRNSLVATLGKIQIVSFNHVVDSRMETILASAQPGTYDEKILNQMATNRSQMLEAVEEVYSNAHRIYDETVSDPHDYAISTATMARAYSLSPFGVVPDTIVDTSFITVADSFASPAN